MKDLLLSAEGLLSFILPAVGVVASGSLAMRGRARGILLALLWRHPRSASTTAENPPESKVQQCLGPDIWLDRVGTANWALLAFGAMLVVNVTLAIHDQRPMIPSMMAKMLCIALIPWTLIYVRHLLADWLVCVGHFVQLEADTIAERFGSRIDRLFFEGRSLATGLAIGVGILLFEYHDNAFTKLTVWSSFVVVGTSLAMTTLAGVALVVMTKGCFIVSEVGRVPFHVSNSPYGILSTGRLFVRAFLAATVVLGFAVSTMLLRPHHHDWVSVSWPLSVTVLYMVMFLLPQWRIHLSMVNFKRSQLLAVEAQVRQYNASFDERPDKATADLLDALRKRRDEITALPEWPFSGGNFSTILGLAASGPFAALLKWALSAITSPTAAEIFRGWIPMWLMGPSAVGL